MKFMLNDFIEKILDRNLWIVLNNDGTAIYRGQAGTIPDTIKSEQYEITHLELNSHTIWLTITK